MVDGKQKTMRNSAWPFLKRLKRSVVGEKTKTGDVVTNIYLMLAMETKEERRARLENDAATKLLSLAM